MADEAIDTTTAPEATTETLADAVAETADESSVLGGDGAEEAAAPAEEAAAAVVPETYELTPPEGMSLDTEALALADPVFRELNLTNDQAQKLMPVAGEFVKRVIDQHNATVMADVQSTRKAWADEAKADKEIGGGKWDETVMLSAKALDMLGYPKGSPFRSFLTDSGLGNHPEMIRAMRRIGERVSEDGFERGSSVPGKKTPEQALYSDAFQPKGA